jgi:hypothetical protein
MGIDLFYSNVKQFLKLGCTLKSFPFTTKIPKLTYIALLVPDITVTNRLYSKFEGLHKPLQIPTSLAFPHAH